MHQVDPQPELGALLTTKSQPGLLCWHYPHYSCLTVYHPCNTDTPGWPAGPVQVMQASSSPSSSQERWSSSKPLGEVMVNKEKSIKTYEVWILEERGKGCLFFWWGAREQRPNTLIVEVELESRAWAGGFHCWSSSANHAIPFVICDEKTHR